VNTDELQITKVTHAFTQPGEHTITETIHSDDLQTQETVTGKLRVEGEEIKEAVKITAQPAGQAVEEGKTATFTASASGIPAPAVQWQLSTNGGGAWCANRAYTHVGKPVTGQRQGLSSAAGTMAIPSGRR
jgi:hypothetical protein